MKWTLNGTPQDYTGEPKRHLLDVLRTDHGVLSPKDGCAPQAACGCCTVMLDGRAVLACATHMRKVEGARVETIEALPDRTQTMLADAFAEHGGAQCGFCIPGIVVRAAALLEQNPEPTTADIEKELRFHLCRCTGYKKIIESIQAAGTALQNGGSVPVASKKGRIGERLAKVDVRNVVLGRRPYVADMRVEGMLHGALRFNDHPRARIKRIDTRRAEALDGVVCVLRAGDVPGERFIGLIYPDWPVLVDEGETTRYTGDVLACVAATTRAIARRAAELIDVDVDVLDPVTDPHEALKPGAPKVHDKGNKLSTCVVSKGDADRAFERCAHISEDIYQTQRIEHGYMEPEACLAVPEEDGAVRAYSQSQGVYEDRRQLCALLGLPLDKVRVELVPNGGGFGGKEDMSVQSHAAMMALKLNRPVRVELSREESLRMSVKRHPIWMHFKLGCDADGRLLALRARIVGDTGAYASVGTKVLERAAGHATGAYTVPNVDVESITVYTNNVPCGAMRGFGANQACFAMESCVDDLIHKGGFDPWQFRWDNALTEGGTTATGQELSTGVGVRATLEAVRDVFHEARRAGRKVGIACGLKNTGIGNGMLDDGRAKIIVRGPDRIELHHGWTEMGQGVDTMALQTFCQETGLPPQGVTVHCRTDAETACGMTTASRATSLVGNALIAACRPFKADLAAHGLEALVGREYFGEWICDWTNKPGSENGAKPVTHYSYSYATQVVLLDDTGKVERVVAAHDAGRVMNPTLFEGQIEGSIHMGLGYALTEDFPVKPDGHPASLMLRSCGILRAHQTPDITVIGVEVPDEHGPYGAKGVGEIGLVPTAAAVGNALFAFDGVRRTSLPMKA